MQAVGDAEQLRLLAKRNDDIGRHRSRVASRLHALLVELVGSQGDLRTAVDELLARVTPTSAFEQLRVKIAYELLDDLRRLDTQLRRSHQRLDRTVKASATSLTDLFGVGPALAATLIGHSGDIARFRNRDHYAAYNGTAPVEYSSGGRIAHRLSRRGNRTLNAAIHMIAVTQLRHRHSAGRLYFERKLFEGKTNKEALRALKRHVSNAVYRQLAIDAAS